MIDVGIIGAGQHAAALLDHRAPIGGFRVAAVREWASLIADPAIRAILVFAPAGERSAPVLAALRAGKIVLCPPPVASSVAELSDIAAAELSGGGRLVSGGDIAHSEAGRRGLAAMRAPEFGQLRSLYMSIRQQRGGAGDVLDTLGWEALDFIATALPTGVSHVRVNAGALFGAARDTAVLLLRGADDAVATVELSRCLPATMPSPGLGEIEIEAVGAHQAVRIEPHGAAVRIYTDTTLAAAPWLDAPVLSMLRAVAHAAEHPAAPTGAVPHAARLLAMMAAIRAAADGAGAAQVAG